MSSTTTNMSTGLEGWRLELCKHMFISTTTVSRAAAANAPCGQHRLLLGAGAAMRPTHAHQMVCTTVRVRAEKMQLCSCQDPLKLTTRHPLQT